MAAGITNSFPRASRIRDPGTLQTHLLLSSSARTPLITLWTASWCASCRSVAPIIREVVEESSTSADGEGSSASGDGDGDGAGAAMYAEVEIDSPTGGGEMGGRYAVRSLLITPPPPQPFPSLPSSCLQLPSLQHVRLANPEHGQITSIPTLLAFSKGEPVSTTRVTDVKQLGDRNFLRKWLAEEVKRDGGGGGGGGGGFLGGLFGGGR